MDLRLKIEENKVVTSLYAKPMALLSVHPSPLVPCPRSIARHHFWECTANPPTMLSGWQRRPRNQALPPPSPGSWVSNGPAHPTLSTSNGQRQGLAYLRCTALDHLCAKSKKGEGQHGRVFLHLPYHPANPSSNTIQQHMHKCIANPNGQPPFHRLTNDQGYDILIDRLTIAWHRPPNLGNLLSYRKLSKRTGLKVSSYIKT